VSIKSHSSGLDTSRRICKKRLSADPHRPSPPHDETFLAISLHIFAPNPVNYYTFPPALSRAAFTYSLSSFTRPSIKKALQEFHPIFHVAGGIPLGTVSIARGFCVSWALKAGILETTLFSKVKHYSEDSCIKKLCWEKENIKKHGDRMTQIELFDYKLPEELIATVPSEKREMSRLLHLDRHSGETTHRHFSDIKDLLRAGDILIVNNARVIPARLFAHRATGGKVEILLLQSEGGGSQTEKNWYKRTRWIALLQAGGRLKAGEVLNLQGIDAKITLLEKRSNGRWLIGFHGKDVDMQEVLNAGSMPLPPYILRQRRRRGLPLEIPDIDRERYQTVFAQQPGAVAAPTAGLHFSKKLLKNIEEKGVRIFPLTLLVGPGTFRPVRTEKIEEHSLDAEFYHLPAQTAAAINCAKEEGRRVIATGTTCCRVLEYVEREKNWEEHSGWTDLYIYPPFEFRVTGGLITNFHLPRSTLLMLVSAFAGRENVLAAYREAIERRYRFYSYGDAMFIS
jgi:S-adenosylmethionine:tRNA ribosyltransferase-isomerase